MIELFNEYKDIYLTFAKDYPFLATAITSWVLFAGSYLLRNIPLKILTFIKIQCTTTLSFNNTTDGNVELVNNFMEWFYKTNYKRFSRTFSISTKNQWESKEGYVIGAGYGLHFFIFNKRLFWFNKEKLDSSGSERQKEEVTITTIGRSYKIFENLIKRFEPINDDNDLIHIKQFEYEWETVNKVRTKSFDSIAIDENIKNQLLSSIDHFIDNKNWYYQKGLPYKQTFIFHGKPGTGKTSIIKALASKYNRSICQLNLDEITNKSIRQAFYNLPKNSILAIEDFDSNSSVKNRDKDSSSKLLSLSSILNVLDGVNSLDDVIIIMTTNYLDHIDPAIYRKGRVDKLIEISEISSDDVKKYIKFIYPDFHYDYHFKPMLGCNLNSALQYAKDNPHKFIEYLKNV